MFISRGKTKSRTTPGPGFFFRSYDRIPPSIPWVRKDFGDVSLGGTQITESDGNRWPPPQGKDFVDCGSEFYSLKKECLTSKLRYSDIKVSGYPNDPRDKRVEGTIMIANAFGSTISAYCASGPNPHSKSILKLDFPPDLSSSRSALNVKGQIAIAACAPANQIANAASAVGELIRDMPAIPGASLWKSRLRAAEVLAKSAGEFLNVVFGVLPTVSDMVQFYTGVHKVDKTVDQFIRDSGRVVRRSFVFPTERTEETTDVSTLGGANSYSPIGASSDINPLYSGLSPSLPVYKTMRKRVIEREVWFSGAFTYYLPDWFETSSRSDRMRLTAKLLGAEPDLNTLWQLAPWSWAVDWTLNAGTWIKSLQALLSYGTVLRYGYVMEKTTITDTFFAGDVVRGQTPGFESTYTSRPFPAVQAITLRTTVKKRVQANPFGFGVSWDGLSNIQRAIVAALGITRVVR